MATRREPTKARAGGVLLLPAAVALLCCKQGEEAPTAPSEAPPASTVPLLERGGDARPAPTLHTLGQTAETDAYELTVSNVRECRREGFTRPRKGNHWLGIDIALEARTARELLANPRDMKLVDGDGVTYAYTYVYKTSCDPRFENRRLRHGQTARGFVTFELPASAKGLELVYDPVLVDQTEAVRFDLGR